MLVPLLAWRLFQFSSIFTVERAAGTGEDGATACSLLVLGLCYDYRTVPEVCYKALLKNLFFLLEHRTVLGLRVKSYDNWTLPLE